MELQQAIALLSNDWLLGINAGNWADLGSGNGTFTLALANLLKPGSLIYAVDKDVKALDKILLPTNQVKIEKVGADFSKQEIPFKELDGIIMANSLHYIEDKLSFIAKAKTWLKSSGCFIIVEYDTNKSNQWVPWPIDFLSLDKLFRTSGFTLISKIAEQSSIFGRAKLYSAIIRR